MFSKCVSIFFGVFFLFGIGCATTTGQNIQTSQGIKNSLQTPNPAVENSDKITAASVPAVIPVPLGREPTVRILLKGRRHGGRIVKVSMESYLAGVIGNEMSRRWPPEALKAQAVAARSYAFYRMTEAKRTGRKYDVMATQADQVFKMRDIKNPALKAIVLDTRGEVLSKEGQVVEAFYSSTCGGKTRTAEEAGLSTDAPLFACKQDNYCARSPFRNWEIQTTLEEISDKLNKAGYSISNLRSVKIVRQNRSSYVQSISIRDDAGFQKVSGDTFRHLMGSYNLKSLLFRLRQKGNNILITGNGFGHGVGMCQYGAKEMAAVGKNYQLILAKYYPGISVVRIY